MDLYEYQAKELFAAHGVPVLPGEVADTAAEARAAAARIGTAVVVKAQVKTGGRGKAGGVKLANDADEAAAKATGILGLDIKGHLVRRVLVTEASDIDTEYYVSYLLDRANRTYLSMASVEGGMEIEQLAVERPGTGPVPVDPIDGWTRPRRAMRSPTPLLPGRRAAPGDRGAGHAFDVFTAEDATLVEVNPLVRPRTAGSCAGRQVTLDDNASFRHAETVARFEDAATERWSRSREDLTVRSTARSASSAGPAWSCPPSTWWRMRERHGGSPGQLPRHRGGASAEDGQRAGDHPRRPGGPVGVRQRLRRHHCPRRGRTDRPGVRLLDSRGEAVTLPLVVGWTATTPGGPADPHEAALPGLEQVDTMDGARSASRSWQEHADVDLPRPELNDHRQA